MSTHSFEMFSMKGSKKFFGNEFKALLRQGKNTAVVALVNGFLLSDLVDDTGTTLLHLSARYNNVEVTKFLVSSGFNVNVTNLAGLTPLVMAATASSFKTAQFLLENHADFYATNQANKTVLQLLLNNKKSPRYIIDRCFEKLKSVSKNTQELAGRLLIVECPIKTLIHLQNPEVLALILFNTNEIDLQQVQAALDTAFRLKDAPNAKVLLNWGSVDIKNPDSLQFLYNMFKSSTPIDLQLLLLFLQKVKNWNELEKSYLFFLEGIFERATKPILEIFLCYNVDILVRNQFPGRDLFIHLFSNPNAGVKDLLLTRGFNVHSRGEKGYTALHLAVKFNSVDDVKLLLSMGADPNAKDEHGTQPLGMIFHAKPSEERETIIKLLLNHGADPLSVEISGDTIIGWAVKCNDITMLEHVLSYIAIIKVQGKPVEQKIMDGINFYSEIKTFFENSCTQLEMLKKFLIYESVTLFTVITGDMGKFARRIPYPQIIASLRQNSSVHKWNKLYQSRLDEFFNLTLQIISLKSKATSVLCEVFPAFTKEQDIVEKVLSYLTCEDLVMFA